jgi:hypothetical protein
MPLCRTLLTVTAHSIPGPGIPVRWYRRVMCCISYVYPCRRQIQRPAPENLPDKQLLTNVNARKEGKNVAVEQPLQKRLSLQPAAGSRQASCVSRLVCGDSVRACFIRMASPRSNTAFCDSSRGAGPDGLPTPGIVESLIEQKPGMTRMLDRLEAKKLERRERLPMTDGGVGTTSFRR